MRSLSTCNSIVIKNPAMSTLIGNVIIADFKRIEKLGEGTYGVVYKAIHIRTNEYVAMKKIRLETQEEGVPSTSVREISVLRELRSHPNIVKLLHVIFPSPLRLYLIFEHCYMDLKKYFDSLKSMNPMLIKSYLYQILRALDFCHCRRIFHRDLKPQNLLIDEDGLIKIADFGLARTFSIPLRCYTHEIVTLWYRCPEVLLGTSDYSATVDMWSIGCIFAEMATTEPLFKGDSEIDQLFKIFRILGTPSDTNWPSMKELPNYKPDFPKWIPIDLTRYFSIIQQNGVDLLLKLLIYDPRSRMIASSAMQHSYFSDFDPELLPPAPPSL